MKTATRLASLFFERVSPAVHSRRWHARAYVDYMRMQSVMVIWPLHYVVQFAHWLAWQWDIYRHRPSWIDRHVAAAVKASEESDARRYIRRLLSKSKDS